MRIEFYANTPPYATHSAPCSALTGGVHVGKKLQEVRNSDGIKMYNLHIASGIGVLAFGLVFGFELGIVLGSTLGSTLGSALDSVLQSLNLVFLIALCSRQSTVCETIRSYSLSFAPIQTHQFIRLYIKTSSLGTTNRRRC